MVVVDDDPQVVHIVGAILRAAGFRVTEAHSGAEALAAVERGCDILVSDVQMPGLSGLDLAERVTCPVLLITGNPGCDPRLNQHAVLHKPFAVAELVGAVREHVASRDR